MAHNSIYKHKFSLTCIATTILLLNNVQLAICQNNMKNYNSIDNFNLNFRVVSEDVRSLKTRTEQSAFYDLVHHGSNQNISSAIARKSSVQNSQLQIFASTGGFLYHLKNDTDEFWFAYNEAANESYIYKLHDNQLWINKGLRIQDIPYIPLPGIGLYKFKLIEPNNLAAPLNGLVEGHGFLDTGEQVPAFAIYSIQSSLPQCTKCTYYFTGTKLPRNEWLFSDFILYQRHWIARKAECQSYLGYSPISGKPTQYPTQSAPLQRTTYTIEAISDTQVVNYDLDSMLKLINRNTAVEFFDGDKGVVSFQYNPSNGSLDIQKRRALALQGALSVDSATHNSRSIVSGLFLLFAIISSFIWLFFKRKQR